MSTDPRSRSRPPQAIPLVGRSRASGAAHRQAPLEMGLYADSEWTADRGGSFSIRRTLGSALLLLGMVAIALAAATLGYGAWADLQHSHSQLQGPGEVLASTIDPASVGSTPASDPTAAQVSVPTPAPDYGPALWVTIPSVDVDNNVMEMGIQDGEYQAPSWDIGHQNDSVDPGQVGNSVFNGHLETINAGHVFAHLKDVEPGDAIYVYTHLYRTEWAVDSTVAVANDDNSFLEPTEDARITLYTCDGEWNPLQQDYTERRVVVAHFVDAVLKATA